nr:mycothione reductase [Kineosphaera limosa]
MLILGSGSGNTLVTRDWEGRHVGIVEHGVFGGTCLNVGCIPTKMFSYSADLADAIATSPRFGVDGRLDDVRWRDIRDRVFGRIDPISAAGLEYRRTGPDTSAYEGHGRFVGERQVDVALRAGGTARLSADQVVIATGSHAVVPEVVRDSGVEFHTSDTVMRIEEVPPRLLILGGGFIAAEFAHIFTSLGSAVTVVARGPRLLRHLDKGVAEHFTALASDRWDVRLEESVQRLTRGADGGIVAQLGDGTCVEADLLLVATGRRASTEDLGCPAGGVDLREDGRVAVDEYGRTSAPGVWALGDVSSPYLLKHVANHEARVVAHNLVHPDDLRAMDHRYVPAAVFTSPQIATVGKTREQLTQEGTRYIDFTQRYGDVAYGWAMEDREGLCTVVADPRDGRLLGAYLVGDQASSLIQPLIQAMTFGQPAHEVARGQYWIHPALAEVVENALLGLPEPRAGA